MRITGPGKRLCTAPRAPETLPVGEAGRVEFNAFFHSPHSLGEFTSRTVEIDGDDYPEPYTGCRNILMIAAKERYMPKARGIGHGPKEISQKHWWKRAGRGRKSPAVRL
ncbi:hypothetical protein EEB11_18575 [Pseudotabrizicola sediminis]|uniref:Uncharacterized protein n=1 Tax=Pseudotabrizicola sediminis TaxID=2486418 RepID=A0ABY2KIB7_9RHOB|nr:hypothetical protein EEB11_18575 [Pseudotabrizicola sediminis]